MTVLKQSNVDSQAELRRQTENHACDPENTLRQHKLVVSDHHREVRSLRGQAEDVGMATVNVQDCPKTVFSQCKTRST